LNPEIVYHSPANLPRGKKDPIKEVNAWEMEGFLTPCFWDQPPKVPRKPWKESSLLSQIIIRLVNLMPSWPTKLSGKPFLGNLTNLNLMVVPIGTFKKGRIKVNKVSQSKVIPNRIPKKTGLRPPFGMPGPLIIGWNNKKN